jgi:hypothetical protein
MGGHARKLPPFNRGVLLKENHTFEGDRPAHDGRVKAISAQMKTTICVRILFALQAVKEDVLGLAALVTERTLK